MTNLTILSKDIRILDGLYSLNDLHKASGFKRNHAPFRFIRLDQIQELIREIERSPDLVIATKVIKGGHKNQGTWVCKELVYSYAMWISARFHLQVIRAFDAMVTAPSPIQGVTLSESQAGFVKCTFALMDKLQSRYQQTRKQHEEMAKQITMMRKFCDQMDESLKQFNSQLCSDYDVVNHVHLYKKMAMDYQGARELKDFIERKH